MAAASHLPNRTGATASLVKPLKPGSLIRLVFRSLILETLFYRLPKGIFHAAPYSGNTFARLHKRGRLTLMLPESSHAARLPTATKQYLCIRTNLLDGFFPPVLLSHYSSGRITESCQTIANTNHKETIMIATQTATKEAATASETINHNFHVAMLEYEKALNSGIQLQENAAKAWKDLLTKAGTPGVFMEALESASADFYPNAHKHVSEFMEACSAKVMLAKHVRSDGFEMFVKTLSIYQSDSIAEAQMRAQELIASTLATARRNFQPILDVNAKIVESWLNIVSLSPIKNLCAVAQSFIEAPLRST